MKTTSFYLLTILVLFFVIVSGCKEEAVNDFDVLINSPDVKAGDTVVFNLKGKAEFVTFYSGQTGQKYEDYPNSEARQIDPNTTKFTFVYQEAGTINATFVATSFGNFSTVENERLITKTLQVVDGRTGIRSIEVKTGATGVTYPGIVNATEGKIEIPVPSSLRTNLVTNIGTHSPNATVLLADDSPFTNNSRVQFSFDTPVIFKVKAPNGEIKSWEAILVVLE
jgi:hypothetical protein